MIDILFLTHNRLEFTKASLDALIENTNWNEVRLLRISDDASEDGTREYLRTVQYPVEVSFHHGTYGGPVAVMNEYLCSSNPSPAHIFAKIDSDTMVPQYWLEECLRVMHLHPGLDLLGIEAFRPVEAARIDHRSFDEARFIGGIGLIRTRAFAKSLPRPNGRFGFTEWQEHHPDVTKGWLNPALPVFLLDRLPREPFTSLSREYVKHGWQREWEQYEEQRNHLWSWWCE